MTQQATKQAQEKARHIQIIVPPDMYREFKKICAEQDTNMRAKLLDLMGQEIAANGAAKKDFFSMTGRERAAMYAEGIRDEVSRHHAADRYTTHGDEKGVYRLYPDGRKQYIDPADSGNEGG